MKLATALLVVTLAGCTSSGELLSAKYCPYVSYERHENKAEIKATCIAPYSVPQLPVAPAALLGGVP